jgi:predicted nuclease of predicted toxin-antitoxin system
LKLLFDQNPSYRLVAALETFYPGSAHVRLLGMERANDETIWLYAKENRFVIVTQDSDFNERSVVFAIRQKLSG